MAALALVLVWPALLAPAHRHASAPGWVGASARSAVVAGQERGRAAAGDDADGCLVCRQLLDVAAYLLPSPAAHLVLAAPELADRAQMATAGFVLRQLRAWHSRAPPAPALY